MQQLELYDTTLRDGTQYEGISLSVEDKLAITEKLDALGVHYIEGGWPGSNPKDAEFFERAKQLRLKHATLTAFGSTRRANVAVEEDAQVQTLLDAETDVVTLVGKSWDLHATHILETSLEENLAMIADTVTFIKTQGRRVFFDAEHFFDGYKSNRDYAVQCVKVAADAGADCVVLCDTNGGALPNEIAVIVTDVAKEANVPLGIHTHNDADMAVAGALAAIDVGAVQVQATVNGYGERCGNANLLSIIGNLKLKKGVDCVTDQQLESLTEVGRYVAELANMPPPTSQPYVGTSAFAHKGGLHASAVAKVEHSYQHVPPGTVGNDKRVLVSELSGRSNILFKVRELGMGVELSPPQASELLRIVKDQENLGFQYEGAEASFELLVRRTLPEYAPPFELVDFTAVVESRPEGGGSGHGISSRVMVKVSVDGEVMHTAADGLGPVNALDGALRKALLGFYPELEAVRLDDFKVRVVDQGAGTGAVVRVLIESTDGQTTWSTVGCSENIIEASWMALSDSLEWWLSRRAVASA
ncbi:MAG: citramalate synthase [SAR202 cluster bacterium]|jgi:2-isopropylmalate synthase|nr:citramalate synthase [SAR202 cluster bacterium]MDP6798517.1 citramalate synthase [SAR202 cluster bacterium]MQG59652.1 citramalate synthase [SAR202 cluster bacterium]MQG69467.1 citramalate synthase [SAR202 cluster bacterium]HAL46849.1 citramalate synthase [Dehalococcoidia bacterium]|tara:strand:+ start:6593 stop:8182 length:1590 start_codon:yes stop_codon:yes gene_type:complete